jgi:hypothetical protein
MFVVETRVELNAANNGDEAGLAVVGREDAAIALVRAGAGCQIICRQNCKITPLATLAERGVRLQLHVADGGLCRFAFIGSDGRFIFAPEPFAAQPGVWIGAKVGLYCSQTTGAGGHADFDYFRFSATDPA